MNIFPQNGYSAALYCRLSRDEESSQESNSITNQRRMLEEYAEKNGYHVAGEYVDDGYSGTNYDRPGFKSMMEDAKDGKFNMILTKDLSRLGREYIATGQYIEQIFPRMGIRYIAINDSYDSLLDDSSADIMPIKNFFNELHAKDTSKKCRAGRKAIAKAGKFGDSRAA